MSRTIGVFVAQLEDAYQTGVWEGIVAQASLRGLALTCFVGPGDGPGGDRPPAGSVAFQVASPQAFGGLIRLSNTLGKFPEAPGLEGLPQVSLGWKLPGLPSVTVDGAPGLRYLVHHLVTVHGRKRFAVVTGPAGHGESEDREAVIRTTLADLGITLDDGLVVRGTFYNASGTLAVRHLLAEGKSFDVLMALNDRMAFGAYEALAEVGLRIPEDVAVTGFDNIEQCDHVVPPLTTVDQPLKTMGILAVDMVADLMEGRVPEDRVLPCEPILRWSCGCPPRVDDVLPRTSGREWDPAVVESLGQLLKDQDEGGFLKSLAGVLELPGGPPGDGWTLVNLAEAAAFDF